jgi:hypothetical protein
MMGLSIEQVSSGSMEKPSVVCGRWKISKVATHVGRLTSDQAVIAVRAVRSN